MDIFGATVTAIHEIWTVTMFIKGVVDDVKSYDKDKADIQARVSHEFVFIEDFKNTFFDSESGREFYKKRPLALKKNYDSILRKFQEILGEYKAKATKYGLVDPEEYTTQAAAPATTAIPKERWLARFKGKIDDLKKKAVDWSIFDKPAIFKMLDNFREWTARLRETVAWMMSTREIKDDFKLDPKVVRSMHLKDTLGRQELAAAADIPTDFSALTGFVKQPQNVEQRTGEPVKAKFSEVDDDWDDAKDVVVEIRKYDLPNDGADAHEKKEHARKSEESMRRLAFLLSKSSFSMDVDVESSEGPALLSLNFKGYLDLPDVSGVLFIYDLPTTNATPNFDTLHGILNTKTGTAVKPTLGNRFFLAHTLATTVLNIHGSRWVHKNIWSKGVVVWSSPNPKWPLRAKRLVPYLTGWGVARPGKAGTNKAANFDVVANLYRHPFRQGQPTVEFRSEHDIYALGVVLIEVGLWQSVDQIFSVEISKVEISKGNVSPRRLLTWWKNTGSTSVKGEMGEGYVEVVNKCLEARNYGMGDNEDRLVNLINFRDSVVDVLGMGLEL